MSNCVVSSGDAGSPSEVIAQHGIEGYDHFAHDCNDDDLRTFVCRGEALVEGFESGVVSSRAKSRHVKNVADRQAPAIDAAMATKLAAVEVIWRKADKGCDLLSAHLAELRQQGDESSGKNRSDPWHRRQQVKTASESRLGSYHLCQALVEQGDICLQPRQTAFV